VSNAPEWESARPTMASLRSRRSGGPSIRWISSTMTSSRRRRHLLRCIGGRHNRTRRADWRLSRCGLLVVGDAGRSGEQGGLAGPYLPTEGLWGDPTLGEAAGGEPEARLSGARVHVAQLLLVTESPDGANAGGNVIAEQLANQELLPLVAGRQHDQIGGKRIAASHPRPLRDEFGDIGK